MKKLSRRNFREANFYFYMFLLFYSNVCDNYPHELDFHGVNVLRKIPIPGGITYV